MEASNCFKLEVIETASDGPSKAPAIIFVHGVCHGSWCWLEHYAPFFARHGWHSYSLSLRGHGHSEGREQLDAFGLDDYVQDVLSIIDDQATPPIIVGHSMGGIITQLLMAQYPEKIAGAVLLATMPPGGINLLEKLKLLRHPSGFFALFKLLKGKAVDPGKMVKAPFFSGRVAPQQVTRYAHLLQPESKKALKEIPKFDSLGGVQPFPLMVLGSMQDCIFGQAAVARTARHYETEAIILEQGCHDLMLDPKWEESAQHILGWLDVHFPAGAASGQQ